MPSRPSTHQREPYQLDLTLSQQTPVAPTHTPHTQPLALREQLVGVLIVILMLITGIDFEDYPDRGSNAGRGVSGTGNSSRVAFH